MNVLYAELDKRAARIEELVEALNQVHDIINSYSGIQAMFDACQTIQKAIRKAE